jgi:hypothetical protein
VRLADNLFDKKQNKLIIFFLQIFSGLLATLQRLNYPYLLLKSYELLKINFYPVKLIIIYLKFPNYLARDLKK